MKGCLASLLGLISLPFAYIVNGWALTVLWGWFVVPTFDAPTLSIPVAIGLAILVGYLTKAPKLDTAQSEKSSKEVAVDILAAMLYSFLHPLIALGVGWIVLQFI